MKYPFTINLIEKPEGYMEAIEALLETPNPLHCELNVPKKRMFMSMTAWFNRYTSVDHNRVCAVITEPVLDKVNHTFSGVLLSYGPHGEVVEKMHGLIALSARMLRDTTTRRVVKIYSFDITQ